MFKLGDMIPAVPDSFSESKSGDRVGKAKVVYIHPEGRFYTLEFTYPAGSFRESRFFTEAEKELGRKQGLFKKAPPRRYAAPACPPGFMMADDEDAFYDMYGGRGGKKKDDEPFDDDMTAAMF